jgi:imidazolonepropionase-like amidohydrolase
LDTERLPASLNYFVFHTVLVGLKAEGNLPQKLFLTPSETLEKAKALGNTIIERLRRAYRIGVKMGFGTDIVVDLPNKTRAEMTWDYLAVWRAAGVPSAEILKCITTNDSELLRVNKQRGAIVPGLAADIVATRDEGWKDRAALRHWPAV